MAQAPQRALTFAVHGPIRRSDLEGLCARVCRLLGESRAEVAFCDVSDVPADAVTVEALARLQLGARHYGCRVRLRRASRELRDVVELMGLSQVLPE
jgi:ABC-type transporter Mla MlaB component